MGRSTKYVSRLDEAFKDRINRSTLLVTIEFVLSAKVLDLVDRLGDDLIVNDRERDLGLAAAFDEKVRHVLRVCPQSGSKVDFTQRVIILFQQEKIGRGDLTGMDPRNPIASRGLDVVSEGFEEFKNVCSRKPPMAAQRPEALQLARLSPTPNCRLVDSENLGYLLYRVVASGHRI